MLVKDILSFGGLSDATVIAGKSGLEREVSSISVIEVAEAKIGTWVLQNQIYLTSFYAISQDVDKQLEVLRALYTNQCSGLILCHKELFLKDIDKQLIDYCDRHDFPLIVANSSRSFVEIMYPIVSKLMDNQQTEYEALNEMQNRLIEQIATSRDLNYVYSSIQKEYGREIYFLDPDQHLIFPHSDREDDHVAAVIEKSRFCLASLVPNKSAQITVANNIYCVLPVSAHGLGFGTIVAEICPDRAVACMSKLKYISNLFSLISTTNNRIESIEKARKQEYLSDLLTWNFRSNDVAIAIGQSVGWNIRDKSRMIIININDVQLNVEHNKDFALFLEDYLFEQLKLLVEYNNPKNLIGLRSDTFIILLDGENHKSLEDAEQLAEKLLSCCIRSFSGSVSLGISRIIKKEQDIPEAYAQAMDALRIGRYFFGDNQITASDHMGYFGILREIIQLNRFDEVSSQLFKKLELYDQADNNSLLTTLKVLILNQMDTKKTSEDLFVHRNTVNYRKQKIQEILGYCPWEMPYLFNTVMYFASDIVSSNFDSKALR